MNRKIKNEVAIGMILATAILSGGAILLQNKKMQLAAGPTGEQYTSQPNINTKIVFLGDSITAQENWPVLLGSQEVANQGISGNTTDDVLGRLDQAIAYKPNKIFLMIGINDLLRGKDVSYVFDNYKLILAEIQKKSPATVVYIQSVLPIDNATSKIGTVDPQKIITLDSKLKTLADGDKLFFIDLYPAFVVKVNKINPNYTVDGVHLNYNGYKVWKKIISSYIK